MREKAQTALPGQVDGQKQKGTGKKAASILYLYLANKTGGNWITEDHLRLQFELRPTQIRQANFMTFSEEKMA